MSCLRFGFGFGYSRRWPSGRTSNANAMLRRRRRKGGGEEEVVDCAAAAKEETYGAPRFAQSIIIHLISFGGWHTPKNSKSETRDFNVEIHSWVAVPSHARWMFSSFMDNGF